jgi:23S rRNA (cytosine1962-C5)-methyltransferase
VELLPNACRLIHAESDGLPGLVVDRYADTLVAQFLSAGAESWRETLSDLLVELTGLQDLYERSDVDVRELEGLPVRTGALRGNPPEKLTITENGLKFSVDLAAGHKTGFYLDQRPNRLRVRTLAKGREVLDCFCYTGGFTVNALAGGAKSVLSVDSSAQALSLARENLTLNGLPLERVEFRQEDVFFVLRFLRDSGRSFDLVVLDPPKFAPTAAQAEKAARGYKDINLLAFKLLRPGGFLATFSCSGGVDAALFQKIVASAALDAGVEAQVVEHLAQGPDHPVALNFPEGAYLKGLVCWKA